MKVLNQLLIAAVVATTLSLAANASAQYKINEDDGIAASPKLRQMLNERKASANASLVASKHYTANTVASANDGIAASPRTRQMIEERKRSATTVASSTAVASAGYRATGADGVTASPRLRQQLNERSGAVMLAPVK